MAIYFLRRLTGRKRSVEANEHLGLTLAFVAGATNAGGFLAVRQYTSHMSGIIAAMSDDLALGNVSLALAGLGAVLSFLAGAACSAILINWARRKRLHSEYASSLLLEAFLLLCFGLLGANLSLHMGLFIPVTVMLLCFIMGLQNAIITKISKAEIRTTHVTGLVTDIGIELGKLFYWNMERERPSKPMVLANRKRLKLLLLLLSMFFVGGVAGGMSFKHIGFMSTVPLAFLLLILAAVPILDDVFMRLHRIRKRA
ncbi:Uncharacterized membrane protein YoaK, UPF0700 family [Collimonas sp. OK242]|nr:Uncharacterized membrane protein YoaK, UPF0700 family [Collimonas sp. OK242]